MIRKPITKAQVVMLLIFIFILLLTGCGKINEGTFGNEADWEDGQGKLPEQIGSTDHMNEKGSQVLQHYFEDYVDIIEQTEYNMPTGKWFIHDDEGEFGYGIPSGTMESGESYTIKLFSHHEDEIKVDRKVRMQLTERDQQDKRSKLIMEDTIYLDSLTGEEEIYSNHLPKQENKIYVLSMEILDQQSKVEDTMVSMIYVPIPEINARLVADQQTYSTSDKQATVTLKNDGPTFLSIGESYVIEKKVNGSWKVVPLDIGFEDIGILINPSDTYDQTIDIDQLTSGEYRIIKKLITDGLDLSATLSAEFTLE